MSDELREDVSQLLREPGKRRRVGGTRTVAGMELSTARVLDGEVRLDLELESLGETITATGKLAYDWQAECRRCLTDISAGGTVELREIFESGHTDGETYPIDGEIIDLEPVIREAVLLDLPLAPLCSETCAGPAPEAFPTGRPEPDQAPPTDPRWAALDDLDFN